MNKILCFLFTQLLAPLVLSAQEQITNFENQTEKSPKHIQYVGKVRDKALFNAWTPEVAINGNYTLWTTDGTAANTYPLKKDENTYLSYGSNGVNCYNYLYYYNGRTDGKTFESFTKPFYGLMKISDKLYCMSQDSLFYIDSLNNSTLIECKFGGYKQKNGILYYSKTDTTDTRIRTWYRFQNEKSEAIIKLSTKDDNYFYIKEVYTLGNYDYFFMEKSSNIQLIKINKKTNTTTFINWGQAKGNGLYYTQDLLISDSKNTTTYFVRYPNDSIEVYQPHTDGTLTKLLADKLDNVAPTTLVLPSYSPPHSEQISRGSMMIMDNNLFISTSFSMGMFGLKKIRLNSYNLLTKELKTSIELRPWVFIWGPHTPKITPLTNDLYKIANKGFLPDKEYIYSFKANEIVDSTQYIDGTFVTLQQNQQVAFLDNVYNVSADDVKTPLIKTDTFATYNYSGPISKIFNNKLLIWKYNTISRLQELYVSNGNKNDAKLIKTFDKSKYLTGIQEFDNKIYFCLSEDSYEKEVIVYSTDGTNSGTQKVTTIEGKVNFDKVDRNQNFIYYSFGDFNNNKHLRKTLVISKNGKTPLILENLLPKNAITSLGESFLTPSQLYYKQPSDNNNLYAIYLLKNNKLTLISNTIEQPYFVYQDKLIYIEKKTVGSIVKNNVYSLDDNQKNTNIQSFDGYLAYVYTLGDMFVVKKHHSENSYTYFYYNLSTQKNFTYTSNENYDPRLYFVDDYMVILDKNKIITLKNGKENVFPLAFTYTNDFVPYKNGFLFIYNSETDNIKTFAYFDLEAQKLTTISKDYTISRTTSVEKNDANVLFYSNGYSDYSYSRKHYYWLSETNEIKEVLSNIAFSRLSTNLFGAFERSIDPNNEIYALQLGRFEGNTFVEKQRIANVSPYNSFLINNGIVAYQTTLEKGSELVKITLDSITHYPEIVKGPKGIVPYSTLFLFNNNLYLSAFTYTNGWQIWKIESDIDKKGFLPLSNEENDVSIKIYPNPTEDNITIETPDFFNYKLVNLRGQEIASGSVTNEKELTISHLPQGLYLLWFYNGKTTIVKKIIKK